METSARIIVADDHPLFREGVSCLLMADPDFDIAGKGKNTQEAVSLATDLLPDVMLLDISMPGSGNEAAKQIASASPVVRIVMLTVSEHDDDVISAL